VSPPRIVPLEAVKALWRVSAALAIRLAEIGRRGVLTSHSAGMYSVKEAVVVEVAAPGSWDAVQGDTTCRQTLATSQAHH